MKDIIEKKIFQLKTEIILVPSSSNKSSQFANTTL